VVSFQSTSFISSSPWWDYHKSWWGCWLRAWM